MFLERLGAISKRIGATEALCLVDDDGIPIESVNSDPEIDLELLAAEMVAQVEALQNDLGELSSHPFRHLAVTAQERILMVSSVANGYYLLLVLGAAGNPARARRPRPFRCGRLARLGPANSRSISTDRPLRPA